MTGMNQAQPQVIAWQHFLSSETEQASLHRVPVEQFIHDCDMEASCMCGPALVVIRMDDMPITVSQHFPLDGTYYDDEYVGQLLAGLYNDDDDHLPE